MKPAPAVATVVILASAFAAGVTARVAAAQVLARFDGQEVGAEEFEAFARRKLVGRNVSELTEAEREQFLKAYLVLCGLAGETVEEAGTWEKTRDLLMRQAMVRQIRRMPVDTGVHVADKELRAYYLLHQDEFEVEESYVFRHIFVNVADLRRRAEGRLMPGEEALSPAELAQAVEAKRQRAAEAYARLQAGEDFEAVAEEYSESGGEEHPEERGVSMAAVTQDDGLYMRGRRIMPEMEEAIQSLEPGEFSSPFETTHGFEIVKLEAHTPAGVLAFDEVRERLARQLGRDARRARKEAVDQEILDGFDVEERFWVLSLPGAATDEVVFSIRAPGVERRYTLAEYHAFVEALPEMTRERLQRSPQERADYVREYVLLDEAAYLTAKQKGLDSDEALNRTVDVELLETVALEEFNRRVEKAVEATPVEEKDLQEVWAGPTCQRMFSVGEEVFVEAFAVGTMATDEVSPAAQDFGRRFALRLARRIAERLEGGEAYEAVAEAYSTSATSDQSAAHMVALEGGGTGIFVSGKPLGAHRVRPLWDVGWVTEDDLLGMGVTSRQAARAVLELASGEVTGEPVAYQVEEGGELPGPAGYLVLRVRGRRESYVRPLSQVREQVEQMLRARRERELRASMYAKLLEQVDYDLNRPAWDAAWRRMREK